MTPIAAILMCCTAGDANVAAAVYAEAVRQRVPVELALAVSCVESGTSGSNPLGVMVASGGRGQVACHRSGRFDATACIQIGVTSLANRLRGCGGNETCAARRYNRSPNAAKYAAKVAKIVKFLRGRK